MNLQDCLPPDLRGPATAIAALSSSFSGAGVYRVEAGGRAYVLKTARPDQPLEDWRRTVGVLRHAAEAGLAPAVLHVDEARRAVVSELVADRGFPPFYLSPQTHEAAIALLGRTVRRVHALPLEPEAAAPQPKEVLAAAWARLEPTSAVPPFVADAVARLLAADPPPLSGPPVLSHNDLHPANLIYDGYKLLLVDWDTAGANEPLYDLATIAVFLRMDEATCRKLLAAYDPGLTTGLPDQFAYCRPLVAILCGATFLGMALRAGAPGDPAATLESAPSLADFYQRLRAGAVNPGTSGGQWQFGLALVKEGAAFFVPSAPRRV